MESKMMDGTERSGLSQGVVTEIVRERAEALAEVERLQRQFALLTSKTDRELLAEVERLRQEIERGWLALGIGRNPQHDVTIADGINRLREQHAARLAEIEEA